MSYCRFSSDDGLSDVYVYASIGDFYAIHVAKQRRRPPMETRPLPLAPKWWERGEEGTKEWMERGKAVETWQESASWEGIDLPYAGESLQISDAGDCADMLQKLKDLGYWVPDGVIECLRQEAAEENQ